MLSISRFRVYHAHYQVLWQVTIFVIQTSQVCGTGFAPSSDIRIIRPKEKISPAKGRLTDFFYDDALLINYESKGYFLYFLGHS
jgi:hypothetical protein